MHPHADQFNGLSELTPVERWRRNAFLRAGFSDENAELLALSRAEVHTVLKTLENGCSLELALGIFL